MFRFLATLIIVGIIGAVGYDYVKNNIDVTEVVNDVTAYIDDTVEKQQQPVTTEPTNSSIVPIDVQPNGQHLDVVTNSAELSEALLFYLSKYEPQFSIEFQGDTSQIEAIINEAYAMVEQHNPYVYGHLSNRNIEYSYTSKRATLNVQQTYLTNANQERYVNGKVTAILQMIEAASMSDIDKVKFVNDYIVQHTRYSEATSASPHSAYAVLFEGKGVCQGYALLAYKMLNELGIENLYVVGEVAEGGHAWNLVKLDGNWYHLDTTWNDPLPDRGNGVSYNYFLISDGQLSKDHTWDMTKYPRAASTMNF